MTYEMKIRDIRNAAVEDTHFNDAVAIMDSLSLSFAQAAKALKLTASETEGLKARIELKQQT